MMLFMNKIIAGILLIVISILGAYTLSVDKSEKITDNTEVAEELCAEFGAGPDDT